MLSKLERAIVGSIVLAVATIALIVAFAGGPLGSGAPAALADVADPDDPISVSSSGSTVTVSGTWSWVKNNAPDDRCELGKRAVGFAVDWGDGSPLEMMWAGEDPATTIDDLTSVQPLTNCGPSADAIGEKGSDGPFGKASHTYTGPSDFEVCVIIYDIDIELNDNVPNPKKLTGNHSINPGASLADLVAGVGSGRNTDNNVEENKTAAQCITLQLTITLDPPTDFNIVGEDHKVTATVEFEGTPFEGADVEFEIFAGPNKGDTGTDSTDANGEATFTYTSDGDTGTDTIQACVVDQASEETKCATAEKTWGLITLDPPTATNTVGEDHTVTATVNDGQLVVGTVVTFEVTDGPNAGDTGTDTTNASGQATFTYTGDGGVGDDTIQACFTDDEEQEQCATATKTWAAAAVLEAAEFPLSGGAPYQGGGSSLPLLLATIAGALALMGAGSGLWLAYQRRRVS